MNSIAGIRQDYKLRSLDEADLEKDAIMQFGKWWNEAVLSEIAEVNAMTLSTSEPGGQPDSRIVLLKGFDVDGFSFYTNYQSSKAKQMEMNNKVALLFFWKELERQVRIQGKVFKMHPGLSDEYFQSRPEGSKIGAWASPQSSVINSRQILEDNVLNYTAQFSGKNIYRPPHWGGYVVIPEYIEFWQGRQSRLHDRFAYHLNSKSWIVQRLAP